MFKYPAFLSRGSRTSHHVLLLFFFSDCRVQSDSLDFHKFSFDCKLSACIVVSIVNQAMLLRLSRSSWAAQCTLKRFNSSATTSFAVKEPSSSHQTTKDDQSTLPIFENALKNSARIALKDHNAEYSYKQLMVGASKVSEIVSALCGE